MIVPRRSSLSIASSLAWMKPRASVASAMCPSSLRVDASFLANPNRKTTRLSSGRWNATIIRQPPLLPPPGRAIRFLNSQPPRSASTCPATTSRAAWQIVASEMRSLRAHLAKSSSLKTLIRVRL